MKKVIILFIILQFNLSLASEFGEYKYSKYLAIQQQIRNQQMIAYRNQLRYQNNPVRNIRYPSANNPYPNITPQRRMVQNRYPYSRYSY